MRLGQTEPPEAIPGRKDAFHVPAVLAASDDALRPGDSVRFTDATLTKVELCGEPIRHGVVDPFAGKIAPGRRVWVLLNPDLIVGTLTHQFEVSTLWPKPGGIPVTVGPLSGIVSQVVLAGSEDVARVPPPPMPDDQYDDDDVDCNNKPPCI